MPKKAALIAKRIAKAVAIAAAAVVATVALALLLLMIPPVQDMVITRALEKAQAELPGEIGAAGISWRFPATIEARGLLWTDEEDTLAAAGQLKISARVLPLLRRDVQVSELALVDLSVDLPAIRDRVGADMTGVQEARMPPEGRRFPREGSVRGVPSLGVDRLYLVSRSLRLTEGLSLDALEISGGFDLRHKRQPRLRLEKLSLSAGGEQIAGQRPGLESAAFDIDMETGTVMGEASGGLSSDLPFILSISPEGFDRFRLLLAKRSGESPPEKVGLVLTGRLVRFDGHVGGLRFDATARTPGVEELSAVHAIASDLEGLPPLEGLALSMAGALEFHSGFAAASKVDIHQNSWIESGEFNIAYRDGDLSLEKAALRLPDLEADLQAWLRPDSLTAQAALHATGTRWLDILRPGPAIADDLSAGFFAQIEGPREAPRVQASLELSGRKGDFVLSRLSLTAGSPAAIEAPIALKMQAEAKGMRLTGSADLSLPSGESNELLVRLSPLVIQDLAGAGEGTQGHPFDAPRECLITYLPDAGRTRIAGLRLTGELGDLRLDGETGKDRRGRLEIESTAEISLNTARVLSGLLPDEARVGDLGPIRGDLELRGRSGQTGLDLVLSIDLGRTDWMDSAVARIRKDRNKLRIDTLKVAVQGLDLQAAGEADGKAWDIGARLSVADARLLSRFYPSVAEGMQISLSADADLTGTPDDPQLAASFTGNITTPKYGASALDGSAAWSKAGLAASLHAAGGAAAGPIRFDALKAKYEAAEAGVFPAKVSVEARGPDLAFGYSGTIDKTHAGAERDPRPGATSVNGGLGEGPDSATAWRIEADDLLVSLRGQDLRTVRPFLLTLQPAERLFHIERLEMQGSMGMLDADGYAHPDTCEMRIRCVLSLPEEPQFIAVPDGLWPREVEVDLSAAGARSLEARVKARGLAMGDRRGLEATLEASSVEGGIQSRFMVSEADEVLLKGDAALPASISPCPPAAALGDGPVRVDIEMARFPLPVQTDDGSLISAPERTAELTGLVAVCGGARSPHAHAKTRIGFPGWPKMRSYSFDVGCRIGPGIGGVEGGPACEIPFSIPVRIPALEGAGLAAVFELQGPSGKEAGGTLVYPLNWSLAPLDVRAREEGEMRFILDAPDLRLSDFDNLLPADYGLNGSAALQVKAEGPVRNPALQGGFKASEMRISMADGSRVSASGEINLSGSRRRPSIDGSMEIHNGVILMPDRPKELHPAEGGAILWELDAGSAGADSLTPGTAAGMENDLPRSGMVLDVENETARARAGSLKEGVAEGTPGAVKAGTGRIGYPRPVTATAPDTLATPIDIDVAVIIPAGLWIRGRGLEVEMAGDLRLVQKGGAPTVTGDVKAVRGQLVLLGRLFSIERGGAVFYGGDEIDPSLDLVMATNVQGTIIRVIIGGTAKRPDLRLTSEPELPEGDIMSLLVFGRTTDELDNDQIDLLGRRATDIAAAFGTSRLEAALSRQLGVDMVRIGKESGEGGGSSLVIGKYINPRVLLKYEQALEERTRFFVNLEYFLTRHFKVETLIGHQSQSAVELNWTSDY